ncbi:MAG: hypothetical protein KC415_05510 [Anaerolineales bacterium]|nr:hypothetical protein [Anaerolineales bacterium]MCA9933358.1 hypothetical protein [Anaerolineales bacterium]
MFDAFTSTNVLESDFRHRWENCCSRHEKKLNGSLNEQTVELILEFLNYFEKDFDGRCGEASRKLTPGSQDEREFVLQTEERLDNFQECLQIMVFMMRQWPNSIWSGIIRELHTMLQMACLEEALGAARTYRRTHIFPDASTDIDVDQLNAYDKQFNKLRSNLRFITMNISRQKQKIKL